MEISRGGKREGAGRPKKVDEELANTRIAKALKSLYKQDENEDNVNSFLIDFIPTERGQMFIAQHLLGKPKEVSETTLISGGDKPMIVIGTKVNG
tara:strand:- start:164 stop:448 length:285 start_codon:yes stop_codon:yes gene_type:complete